MQFIKDGIIKSPEEIRKDNSNISFCATTYAELGWVEYVSPIEDVPIGYYELRRRAYATIPEQLDMQYWDQINGTTVWKDHIATVKLQYPKG